MAKIVRVITLAMIVEALKNSCTLARNNHLYDVKSSENSFEIHLRFLHYIHYVVRACPSKIRDKTAAAGAHP